MDLKSYLNESKRSVPEKNIGLLLASGITAIIAAVPLLFSVGRMGFYGALFLLASSALAVCAFAFARQNFGYYIVPLALGALASLAGFFGTLFVSAQYGYHGLCGYSFAYSIGYIAFAAAFILTALYFTEAIKEPIAPIVLCAISAVLCLILGITDFGGNIFIGLIFVSVILLILATMEESEMNEIRGSISFDAKAGDDFARGPTAGTGGYTSVQGANAGQGFYLATDDLTVEKNVAVCIILTLVTFGIYGIYWLYTICRKVKIISGDYPGCAGELLCLIFVPFYNIYWAYTRAEKLSVGARRRGIVIEDNKLMYMILAIFGLMIIAEALIQNDLNRVAASIKGGPATSGAYYSGPGYGSTGKDAGRTTGDSNTTSRTDEPSAAQGSSNRSLEILKQLADLRDSGIISDEEFEEKKKKLLGDI